MDETAGREGLKKREPDAPPQGRAGTAISMTITPPRPPAAPRIGRMTLTRRGPRFAVLALSLMLMAGCATVDKEDFMAPAKPRGPQQRAIRDMDSKLSAISQSLTAGRGQAGLLAQVQALQQDLARINGRVDENAHRLASMPSV